MSNRKGSAKREPEEAVHAPKAKKAKEDISTEGNMKEVLVEFKFRSCETYLVEDGQWEGKFNVKMMQNQSTGRFSLLNGENIVNGQMIRDNLYDDTRSIWGTDPKRGDDEKVEQSFQGTITKDVSNIAFSLGMDLVVEVEEDVNEFIEPHGSKEEGDEQIIKVVPFTNKSKGQLKNWTVHQGGMLVFQAHADISADIHVDDSEDEENMTLEAIYKLKLYAVLSVHIPNKDPTKAGKGHKVDWAFLENVLVSRFPNKDKAWARRGVYQYRLFLELKIENEDWNSTKFSPSGPIDEIWHAHISFRERYQQDIFSLTNNQHLVEHTPVLQADSIKRYKAAYKRHVQKSKETGETIDPEFWPDPNVVTVGDSSDDESDNDESSVDSDAHLDVGYAPSCG